MLSYQIKNPRERHKRQVPPYIQLKNDFDTKPAIFERHLNTCHFAVGDEVQFKKPQRNKVLGTIMHIESDITKVSWINSGRIPALITIKIANKGYKKGATVKTHVKSIVLQPN